MTGRAILLGLALSLLVTAGRPAKSADCWTNSSGSWSDPSIWSSCNGSVPGVADTATIWYGTDVTYDANTAVGNTTRRLVISGSLAFQPGEHRLQVEDQILIGGTLTVANGSVLAFNSNSLSALITNLGVFVSDNVQGLDVDDLRNIDAMTASSGTPLCGGGNRWSIQSKPGATPIGRGDLVQFADGAAQGRMFEVVEGNSRSLTLCSDLPDSLSTGPRLTPHAPSAATPVPTGNAAPAQVPEVGDRFWAWTPWRIESVGSVGWGYKDDVTTPNSGRLEWIGGDLSGYGNATHGIDIRCDAARPPVVISHNNMHDHTRTVALKTGALAGSVCDRPKITWNVIHDGTVPNANFHIGVQAGDTPITGGVIAWNTFYRTAHNTLQVNSVGLDTPVIGFDVAYNTGFEIGTTGTGECEFIEIDVMSDTVVQFNRAWRISEGCGGIVAKPSAAPSQFRGNLVRWNFLQGGRRGIDLSTSGNLYADNYAIGNYVADMKTFGISAFSANGNIVRRWSEGNGSDGNSNLHAIQSHFANANFVDGDSSQRAVLGIKTDNDTNAEGIERTVTNNLCRGLGNGQHFPATCVLVGDGSGTFDIRIDHNVVDCGWSNDCDGVTNLRSGWDPSGSATARVTDNVAFRLGAGSFPANTQASSQVADFLQNLTRAPPGTPPATGEWSGSTGEVARDPMFVDPDSDWNYLPGSAEPGNGSAPPGSSNGIRARVFPDELFPSFLRHVMQVPPDTLNDPVSDFDGDGVEDGVDNCSLSGIAQNSVR